MQQPTREQSGLPTQIDAIERLVQGGAHMLPTAGKAPLHGFRWKRQRLTLPEAQAWTAEGRKLGIVPASVGCTVADVDRGDPAGLVAALPPLVTIRTLRAGGLHLWYRDAAGRPNATWEYAGCGGDIRSASGYVVLHAQPGGESAEELLAGALVFGRPQGVLFPADAFRLTSNPALAPGQPAGPGEQLRWGAVGRRHKDLHAALKREGERLLAQGHIGGRGAHLDDREGFQQALRSEAQRVNGLFDKPLPDDQVQRLADWYCSKWFRSRKRFKAGKSPARPAYLARQRRKARNGGIKSGRRRRSDTKGRDARIVALHLDGLSQRAIVRQISRECGERISRDVVRHTLKRDHSLGGG